MLAADIGGQPATLVALEAAAPAVDRTLCPEQVVKDLVQARAALPVRVAQTAITFSTEKSPKTLMPLRDTMPGGKRSVSVSRMALPI